MKKLFNGVFGFIKSIFSDTKKTVVAILALLVLGMVVAGSISSISEQRERQEALDRAKENQNNYNVLEEDGDGTNDIYLLSAQEELVKSYGELPEGYLWDVDGTLLSLGDKEMTSEEVIYAYLNGLRNLDISMAQKYSRNSQVVSTYSSYFNSSDLSSDYYDSFIRNMYKEVLLSIEPIEIVDTTVFAESKQVYTMKLRVLDLTSKDFWEEDKEEIYRNLYIYSNNESDSTKGEMYLYEYVLDYYRSDKAVTREVTVNLTLEKYPDLDTGWLISIDKDINDICSYTDGTLMVNYINRMYTQEGVHYMQMEEQNSITEVSEEGEVLTTEGVDE